MKRINIGIIGFGTVGAGTFEVLTTNKKIISDRVGIEVAVKKIADLDIESDRGISVDRELLTADAIEVIDDPEVNIIDLMRIIKGPDFPTGGIIYGKGGILQAYSEGKGLVRVRAKTHIEEKERKSIIITELP